MATNNCTVSFYLKPVSKKAKQGQPVYCRIIVNRKKAEFFTGEHADPEKWSNEGMPLRNPRLQEYLSHIQERILSKRRELEYQQREITAMALKDYYRNGDAKETTQFCSYFDEFFNKIKSLSSEYSPVTLKKYHTTIMHFRNFLQKRAKEDVLMEELDLKMVKDFDYYLRTTKTEQFGEPMTRNSANSYHRKIKAVLSRAKEDGMIAVNPYSKFKLKDDKNDREYLTKEELEILETHALGGNKGLEKVRDIFLFSCYSGLRYQDAQELTNENVFIDGEGNYFLTYIQNKTGKKEEMPMLEPAVKIYHKYDFYREVTGLILPKISNVKVNAYLKTIAEMIGIKKKITHHVARHTFATTITLTNGVPLEMVSAFLGHADTRTTRIYAKMTTDLKLAHTKMLNEKLKK